MLVAETDFHFISDLELSQRFVKLLEFDNVIIAVSGGSDSLALLYLVRLWHRQQVNRLGLRLRLLGVTIDHGLRVEAKHEVRQIREWTCSIGIEHRSITWYGDKPVSAVQDTARKTRYQLLKELVLRLPGRSVILTGHTRNDQAETVLMRLARGSGAKGLAGIAKCTRIYGYHVLRPLLDLSREELQEYLISIKVMWLNDPSNEVLAFERVRIRKKIYARKDLGLEDAALARTAQRMARTNFALEDIAVRLLREKAQQNPVLKRYGIFLWEYGTWELPDEIAIRVLRRIVYAIGGHADLPSLQKTENLLQYITKNHFRGATLAGCQCFSRKVGFTTHVLFFRERGRVAPPNIRFVQAPATAIWDRRFRITIKSMEEKEISVAALGSNLSVLKNKCDLRSITQFGIPANALMTLPGFYVNEELVAVPNLDWGLSSWQISSEFIMQNLFGRHQTE